MSDRLSATLLAFAASLIGVFLWVILHLIFSLISTVAGALMGILFILVYSGSNPSDDTYFKYFWAVIVTFIDILLAEYICLAILGSTVGVTVSEILEYERNLRAIRIEILIGFIFSLISLGWYIIASNKKTVHMTHKRIRTDTIGTKNDDEEFKENEVNSL